MRASRWPEAAPCTRPRRCNGGSATCMSRRSTQSSTSGTMLAPASFCSALPSSDRQRRFPNTEIALVRQTLSAVWQEHTHAEFVLKDADAALATMVEDPYVLCIPSGTGGMGRAEVRDFYARQFLPRIPPDLELNPLSQVFGGERLVEE